MNRAIIHCEVKPLGFSHATSRLEALQFDVAEVFTDLMNFAVSDDRLRPDLRVFAVVELDKLHIRTQQGLDRTLKALRAIEDDTKA